MQQKSLVTLARLIDLKHPSVPAFPGHDSNFKSAPYHAASERLSSRPLSRSGGTPPPFASNHSRSQARSECDRLKGSAKLFKWGDLSASLCQDHHFSTGIWQNSITETQMKMAADVLGQSCLFHNRASL